LIYKDSLIIKEKLSKIGQQKWGAVIVARNKLLYMNVVYEYNTKFFIKKCASNKKFCVIFIQFVSRNNYRTWLLLSLFNYLIQFFFDKPINQMFEAILLIKSMNTLYIYIYIYIYIIYTYYIWNILEIKKWVNVFFIFLLNYKCNWSTWTIQEHLDVLTLISCNN